MYLHENYQQVYSVFKIIIRMNLSKVEMLKCETETVWLDWFVKFDVVCGHYETDLSSGLMKYLDRKIVFYIDQNSI